MVIGSKYIYIDTLTSTNTYASTLLKSETVPEGTIIYTYFQTNGKGQRGNYWESENGKNLLISIIIYPVTIELSQQFIISKAISLALCDFLKENDVDACIKWPNDIYVGDDKIAGILIESGLMKGKIENTIIGIGLNINQQIFRSGAPNPVSLSLIKGKEFDLKDCLTKLVSIIDNRYLQLRNNEFLKIDKEYLEKLYRYGELKQFRDKNRTYTGRIVSVDSEGNLLIEDESGAIINYSFKEVEFIR